MLGKPTQYSRVVATPISDEGGELAQLVADERRALLALSHCDPRDPDYDWLKDTLDNIRSAIKEITGNG